MAYVTFAKRSRQLTGPTFRFFGSNTAMAWPRTFIFGRMADAREPPQSFLFWPTLTYRYFCHCDTHSNNELQLPSAYTAVVGLPTTAAFLVDNCILTEDVCSVVSGDAAVSRSSPRSCVIHEAQTRNTKYGIYVANSLWVCALCKMCCAIWLGLGLRLSYG